VTRQEKLLYHQIHPLKLLPDITAGFAALPLLRRHRLRAALLVALVPPILASALIVRYADLEPCRRSRLGRYVERYMTREMELVRLAGYLVMALGAWHRRGWTIPLGLLVVLFGQFRGLLFPGKAPGEPGLRTLPLILCLCSPRSRVWRGRGARLRAGRAGR
jgi:hypothetical protein